MRPKMKLATRNPVLCEFMSTFSHVDLRFVSKILGGTASVPSK